MSSVFTTIQSKSYIGNTIDDDLLGINMRAHHNRLHEDSEFRQVIDQMNANSLRFPGGTISEEHFDITDPDAGRMVNVMHLIHPHLIPARTNGVPVERTMTPLSDYISYVNELEGEPVIVLPTYRFFDQNTRGLTVNAQGDIRTFVRELLSDEYGEVGKVTIEIGNEFYQSRFNWNDTEFGAVQAAIARFISSEARNMGLREDLTLLAQSGRSLEQNQKLAAFFNGQSDTIEGVTHHIYGTSAAGNPLAVGDNIPDRFNGIKQGWGPVLGRDFDIAVTEWNVGENGPNSSPISGLERTAPLLHMFSEMVRNGADMAQIWSARVDGPSGLAMRREDAGELTPTGHFYSMLSESTHGLNLVNGNSALRSSTGQQVGYTYTFEGEGRSVTYFASASRSTVALSAEPSVSPSAKPAATTPDAIPRRSGKMRPTAL